MHYSPDNEEDSVNTACQQSKNTPEVNSTLHYQIQKYTNRQ